MVADHVVDVAVESIELVDDSLHRCEGLFFWAEAVDNVPEVECKVQHRVAVPSGDCPSKDLETVPVVSGDATERVSVGYVCVLDVGYDTEREQGLLAAASICRSHLTEIIKQKRVNALAKNYGTRYAKELINDEDKNMVS